MATPSDVAAGVAGADAGVRQLLLNLSDAAIVLDASDAVSVWNAAAERLFGWSAADVLGSPIEVLLPKPDGRVRARRKDGHDVDVETSVTPLDADAKLLVVREAAPRLDRLSAVMATALADSGTPRDVLGRAAHALVRHFDAAFARIWTLDEADQVLELRASAGLYTHLDGGHSRVPFGELKVGRIAAERRPHLTNDVVNDPSVDRCWATREGMVAFAGYPLVVEQRVVGVVALFARHPLSPDALQELLGASDLIGQYVERKRAQDLLELSERRYRAMIEHAHGVISILAPDGTILYESPYVHSILGFVHGERVGTNGFNLIHPDDRERALRAFSALVMQPGDTVVDEFRFQHTDGSWRWLEVTGHNLLADPSVAGVVVYTRDVSERKQSEHDLQQSEERFRALIERSSDMITLHRRNGTISYASPSTARVLGYEPSTLVEHNLLDYVHPDDRLVVAEAFRELLCEPGRSTTGRYRMRHHDGSWRWIETTRTNLLHEPSVAAVVSNRRDVTNEVEAQQVLEQTITDRTQELSRLLEVSRAMGSTLEWEQLVKLIFDQLKMIFDYSAVGLHIATEQDEYQTVDYRGPLPREQMLANRNSPAIIALLKQASSTGRPVIIDDFGGETPMMGRFEKEGIAVPAEAFGHARATLVTPLLAMGRYIGGLILMHRVPGFYTARNAEYVMAFAHHAAIAIENARLYEALRDRTALEERQRLARELHDSVSQALYAIALNGAAASASLRKQDHRRATTQVRHVRQLARAGLAEMRALIFELRAESLAEEGLVAALAKQAAAMESRHELKIRSTFATEPELSLAAKEALYRCAQEALHNVVKHARARRVELSLAIENQLVVLTVCDDGQGFDPSAAFPGHLGLRSFHERAQAVGGACTITSAPRSGATVRVQVPLVSADSHRPPADVDRAGSTSYSS